MTEKRCLCGSGRPQKACCGPYLAGNKRPRTAEALMRSRYSAFCTGNIDYLMATHLTPESETSNRATLQQTIASTQWVNLIILSTQKGNAKNTTGLVEFVAAYRTGAAASLLSLSKLENNLEQLHERSHFVKKQGQWFYTEGDILPPYVPKPGQPCWCGSKKKYRTCHRQR